MVELDRLTDYSINPAKGNTVIGGKEVDADGRPVAYHVLYGEYNTRSVRIPADEIRHVFRRDRPGQQHGLSWYTPVLSDLQQFADIKFYRLVANKVQSAIALIVSQDADGRTAALPGLNPAASDKTNANGDQQRFLEAGMIHRVGTGKVTPFLPNPSNDLEIMTKLQLRGVAVGFGISYEWLSGDYDGVTFAGGRLTRQDARRRIMPIHAFHCRHVEAPVHRDWVDAELSFGVMRPPPGRVDPYAVHFSLPRADSGVNPLQDANAAIELIRENMLTLRDYYEQQGKDWMVELEQIEREKDAKALLLGVIEKAINEGASNGDQE
jgi:capsid protein